MKRSISRVMTVAVALAVVCACGSTSSQQQGGKLAIKIGTPNELTGAIASVNGVEHGHATEVAAADINGSNRRVSISLEPMDTRSTVPDSVAAAQSYVADPSISAIVGLGYTPEAQAIAPILNQNGLPVIFLQVTQLPSPNKNLFTMAPSLVPILQVEVDQVLVANKVTKIGLIAQDTPGTKQLGADVIQADAEKRGITISDYELAGADETSFDLQITKVLASNPQAIGFYTLPAQGGLIVSKLRARGFKGILFGNNGSQTPGFEKVAGVAAEGVYAYALWDPSVANAEAKRVMALYRAKYPNDPANEPDYFAMQAWDAMHILAEAYAQAGSTDPAKVIKALSTGTFSGALGSNLRFVNGFMQLTGLTVQLHADGTTTVVK
jgi:branched-chain amino acid transport system substrate-binding protein